MNKTLIGMGLGVAMVTLGASQGAEASVLLRLSTATQTLSCDTSIAISAVNCDGPSGFIIGPGGGIGFTGTIDGWGFTGSPSGVVVANTSPGTSTLAKSAEVAGNVQHLTGASDLTIDFGINGFTLPTGPNMLLSGSQSGTYDASLNTDFTSLQVWGRPDNILAVPGTGVGGATELQTTNCVSNGTVSNACSTGGPDVAFTRNATPFALTGRQVIHMGNLAQSPDNSASFTSNVTATGSAPVPEPASMLLLGTGLLSLARRVTRKGRKQTQTI